VRGSRWDQRLFVFIWKINEIDMSVCNNIIAFIFYLKGKMIMNKFELEVNQREYIIGKEV